MSAAQQKTIDRGLHKTLCKKTRFRITSSEKEIEMTKKLKKKTDFQNLFAEKPIKKLSHRNEKPLFHKWKSAIRSIEK